MKPVEHQERHIRLHQALDELLTCYLGENMGAPGALRRENGLASVHNPICDLLQWSHQKAMVPTEDDDREHSRSMEDFESQRQMICLALASLALERPGFEMAIKEIARYYDGEGLPTYEAMKHANADRVKESRASLGRL